MFPTGEQGVTYKQMAAAIAEKLGTDIRPIDGTSIRAVSGTTLPVKSISMEEASQLYGAPTLAAIFSFSNDLDNTKTREVLAWNPTHTNGFLAAITKVQPSQPGDVPVGS